MPKIQAIQQTEVKKEATLPEPTVTCAAATESGVEGLRVTVFYPMPESLEPLVKKRSNVYGQGLSIPLEFEQNGKKLVFADENGNPVLFSGKISSVQPKAAETENETEGEGEDDDDLTA